MIIDIVTTKQIRNLKPSELSKKIIEVKQALFELKFKQATRQSIKNHLFKQYKRMLAQMLTIEHNYKKIQ